MDAQFEKIFKIVEEELSSSSHDIAHVIRVYKLCNYLAEFEVNVNREILLLSAILHDIARIKEDEDLSRNTRHEILGSEMAENILRKFQYDDNTVQKVKHCIVTHRFRGENPPLSIEAKILFDADKLDSIGAIGIARCYIHIGEFGGNIYLDEPIEEYIKTNIMENGRVRDFKKHSPNFEYELKLKKIPQKLYTNKAKELAQKRLKIMEEFFEELSIEIKQ